MKLQHRILPAVAVGLIWLATPMAQVSANQPSPLTATELLTSRIDAAGGLKQAQLAAHKEGKKLAEDCALCHGNDGNKQHDANARLPIPNLANQQPLYLLKQLRNFQSRERDQSLMHGISKKYTDDEFVTLSLYFSGTPLIPYRVTGTESDLNTGESIFQRLCIHCHSEEAKGQGAIPRLNGQNPDYIATNLIRFRDKLHLRKHAGMSLITSKLTDEEIKALAVYLSGL